MKALVADLTVAHDLEADARCLNGLAQGRSTNGVGQACLSYTVLNPSGILSLTHARQRQGTVRSLFSPVASSFGTAEASIMSLA